MVLVFNQSLMSLAIMLPAIIALLGCAPTATITTAHKYPPTSGVEVLAPKQKNAGYEEIGKIAIDLAGYLPDLIEKVKAEARAIGATCIVVGIDDAQAKTISGRSSDWSHTHISRQKDAKGNVLHKTARWRRAVEISSLRNWYETEIIYEAVSKSVAVPIAFLPDSQPFLYKVSKDVKLVGIALRKE